MANGRRYSRGGGQHSNGGGQSQSNGNGGARKNNQKKTEKRSALPGFAIFLIVAAAAGIIAYMNISPYYKDVITPGVVVDGVDLSGMSRDEAYARLSQIINNKADNVSVTIHYNNEKTWYYGADELNPSVDITALVDNAMAIGHSGNLQQRMSEAKAAKAGQYVSSSSLLLNTDNLDAKLEEIKQEIDKPAVEPSLSMNCEGDKFTIEGHDYYQPGVDTTPLFQHTPGSDGYDVNVQTTKDLIVADLAGDYSAEVELAVNVIKPVTSEEDTAIPNLIFHSSSKLRSSTKERTSNIRTALLNFDGRVIAPGEIVDFNEIVGQRTPERGYQKAHVINQEGALVDDYGGGICQAATTLYNCALRTGCQVIERNPHSWPLYYLDYDYGLDSMVNWGSSNMIFQNTTGSNLYLDFYMVYSHNTPTYVDIDIYGAPIPNGETITMECNILEQVEPKPPVYIPKTAEEAAAITLEYTATWEYDPALNLMKYEYISARTGMTIQVFRIWSKDGEEVRREEMYTTTYKPQQAQIYTTPVTGLEPTPPPEGAVG